VIFGKIFKAIGAYGLVVFAAILAAVPSARAQTPSPLQEWQYSSGIALQRLFEPNIPDWQVVMGAAIEHKPLYDGAELTRTIGGPVINVRYKDLWFASIGEGLGVNLWSGDHYRAGLAISYDLGRYVHDDVVHLTGLGDLKIAAAPKAFISYVISKSFPLVVRADVRQILGGADGLLADLGAYMPVPGSSQRFVMFAGPSYTYADHRYMQREFGVTTTQSMASGYPVYDAHSGSDAMGFGFSSTFFITRKILLNFDAAINHLLGSAGESPITQKVTQHVFVLSVAYSWQ
jgi:outer membrane scaffolding protein for murein synthesis (MipA/OmpV family)